MTRSKITSPKGYIGGPLTLEQAIGLFQDIADIDEIPFYSVEGCQARWSKMMDLMEEIGIATQTICAFAPSLTEAFYVEHLREQQVKIRGWRFHIAPVIDVEIEKGAITKMVFDPGLFDGPVLVSQWKNIMQSRHIDLSFAFGQSGVKTKGSMSCLDKPIGRLDSRDIRRSFGRTAQDQKYDRRHVLPSKATAQYYARKDTPKRPISGKTWTISKKYCPQQPYEKKHSPSFVRRMIGAR